MSPRDWAQWVTLAAIWGASFLFMRMGAAEWGPWVLAALRVGGASLLLVPLWLWRGQPVSLRRHGVHLLVVGLCNAALPFVLFGTAALSINSGLSAIFNATTPLFGALVAGLWLGDRLDRSRILGLLLGFGGVVGLAWEKATAPTTGAGHGPGAAWAIGACLSATLLYGFSASYTKRHLQGVAPLSVAAGSQLAATLVMALPAWWLWPATPPSPTASMAALALSLLCTGVAYVLFFRLIASAGPANAITVTYLIPVFAAAWGWAVLRETPSLSWLWGGCVILCGTALSTGLIRPRLGRAPPPG